MVEKIVYCPFCGAENTIDAIYCINCGNRIDEIIKSLKKRKTGRVKRKSKAKAVKEEISIPKGVSRKLSPAALIWLFRSKLFRDYRISDLGCMIAATLFKMEHDGIISLSIGKRGRLFKKDIIIITKNRNFKVSDYGFLSRRIYKLPTGGNITVYDLIYSKKEYSDPMRQVIESILSLDINRKTLDYIFEGKPIKVKGTFLGKLIRMSSEDLAKSLIDENVKIYWDQALELKKILDNYYSTNKDLFRIIDKECKRALSDMQYYEGY